jgi:hypothetical protein
MKNIFTLIKLRRDDKWTVALGPESSRARHRALMKKLRVQKTSDDYAAVCMCLPLRMITLKPDAAYLRRQPAETIKVAEASKPAPEKVPIKKATKKGLFASRVTKTDKP